MKSDKYPEWPTTIGKIGTATLPDGTKQRFTVVDEIRYPASNMPGNKVFYLQKLEWDMNRPDKIEYRFCYYIIGKKSGMRGRWVFGQFAPMIPAGDLRGIVNQAQEKGWL